MKHKSYGGLRLMTFENSMRTAHGTQRRTKATYASFRDSDKGMTGSNLVESMMQSFMFAFF